MHCATTDCIMELSHPCPSACATTERMPSHCVPSCAWRRYHPHFHGSSSLQEQSASGPILVTSDVKYLTLERGCAPLMALLEVALTRRIYLQAFMFQDANLTDAP